MPQQAQKLVPHPEISRPNQYRNLRTVKLLQPVCEECQKVPTASWWDNCPHGDPYVELEEHRKSIPSVEEREDGTKVINGYAEEVTLVERLRMVQVPLNIRINSGRGVEEARARGCVGPETRGYQPMCQFFNCWKPVVAKFRTVYGDYCSDEHTRLIAADEDEATLEVFDMRKRNRQLRAIDIATV